MKIGIRTPLPEFISTSKGRWQSGELLICTAVIAENIDVNSYRFETANGTGFDFKPGQHISIRLPLTGGDEYRTFTICSSPTHCDEITLTVKTNRTDGATAWMRDNIKVGSTLYAVGPTGLFNLVDHPCEKLLLISAGSGITPMMSMLRWLSDRQDDIDVTFIHYAKNKNEYLFSEELAIIAKEYSAVKVYQISTHAKDAEIYGLPSRSQIATLIDITEHQVFCCGPSGFMETIKKIILKEGLNPDHYHQESFGADIIEPDLVDENAETVIIKFNDKTYDAKHGETLLSVLRKNKIIVPSGCKSGMCGTCQMKLISGKVNMNHRGGISERQIEEGYILSCCSLLTENISIL